MLEFFINSDSKCLEYSNWGFFIKTCIFYDTKEFECCLYWCNLSGFDDCFSDKESFFLIGIERKYLHQLTSIKFFDEIFCCFSSCSIESHIQWGIKSERKTSFPIIIVSTAHTKIIEDKVYSMDTFLIQYILQFSETRMMQVNFWMYFSEILEDIFCELQIISISINSDKYVIFVQRFYEHPGMSSESKCPINNIFFRILKTETFFYFIDEHWIML